MSNLPFNGWTLITGASRGIGEAIVRQLAEAKFKVILLARNESRLSEICAQIHQSGGQALWFRADLTKNDDLSQLSDWLRSKQLPIAHVILNAGLARVGKILEMPLSDWRLILETNVLAPVNLLQTIKEFLLENGKIIFINSVAGKTTFPEWGAYAASKFALKAIAQTLRQELAEQNIHVTSIFPSSVETPLHDELGLNWERSKMLKASDIARAVLWALKTPERVNLNEISLENIKGLF